MVNFHSKPGHPRIPVAKRTPVGGQNPNINMGMPNQADAGIDPHTPVKPKITDPHAGQVRVSPGIYRPLPTGMNANQWHEQQTRPEVPVGNLTPMRPGMNPMPMPPGGNPEFSIPKGEGIDPRFNISAMPDAIAKLGQLPNGPRPYGMQRPGMTMGDITRNAIMDNFGFAEPNAGAMRPRYY